jgi:hypothetical protein
VVLGIREVLLEGTRYGVQEWRTRVREWWIAIDVARICSRDVTGM